MAEFTDEELDDLEQAVKRYNRQAEENDGDSLEEGGVTEAANQAAGSPSDTLEEAEERTQDTDSPDVGS